MKNAIYKHLSLLLVLAFSTAAVQARIEPTGIKNQPATLSFKENKGQVVDQFGNPRNDIQYKMDAGGMNIFAGNGALHYQWHKPSGDNKATIYRMDVSLLGANKNAVVTHDKAQTYTEYYYNAGAAEALTVHTYNTITYKDIYPNIDWVLYVKDNQLKYDFIVHPGGDVKKIQLRYDGTSNLKLQNGSLIAETPMGTVTEQKPFSYDAETKQQVASDFVLTDNTLTFGIGKNSGNIVIDPALFWATYYGGSGSDDGRAVGTDASGNVVFAGQTSSTSNIATTGAFQIALSGVGSNAYLVKFNSLGVRQWGTYYGGPQTDFSAVHIDLSGNVYAAGSSTASGLSSAGAYQITMAGVRDAILVKFNSTGTRQWATYYGGTAYDEALAMDIDPAGNVYIGGRTFSTTSIASVGAYQTTLTSVNGTWEDGFAVKFNSSGVRQWATYYGGDSIDYVKGLAVDASGNVYLGGQTYSPTRIATAGATQTTLGSTAAADGFLTMLNTSGVRQWGTYYGGTGSEIVNAVTADILGNVYITGTTNSTAGIATAGTQQTFLYGGTDAYLVKFSTAGVRQWGSYFGYLGNEEGLGIGVNTAGTIYFAGTTNSTANIATAGNFQTSLAGGVDNYIEKFGPTGGRQEGTYFGGTGTEYTCAFAYSDAGMLFLGGFTGSTAGITSIASYQSSFGGGLTDGFLAAFNVTDTVAAIAQPFVDTIKCTGDNMSVTFGVTSTFRTGNVFSVQLSNAAGSFASPTVIGSLSTSNGGTISCTIPAGTASGTGYRIRIISTLPVKVSADNGKNISIGTKPANLLASANSPACTGRTLNLTATTSTTGTITYSWTGPNSYTSGVQNPNITNISSLHTGDYIVTATNNQCSSKDTVTVTVYTTPTLPVLSANAPCEGDTLKLTASNTTPAASAYSWTGPNTFTAGTQNPMIIGVTTAATGTYKVVATSGNGCNSDTANVVVTIQAAPVKPVATSTSPICSGNTLNLFATTTTTGVTYSWIGPNSFISAQQNPTITNADTLATGDYIVFAHIGACSRTDTVAVTVNFTHTPSLSITSNPANPTAADTVTFTASMTGCKTTPVYLWKKNGYFVLGVTGAIWKVGGLSAKDTINGVGVCNDPCAIPQTVSSNAIGIDPVGVHSIPNNLNVALYPNPNNGNFTIAGNVGNEKAIIAEVLNTVGQVIYQEKITPANNYISKTISIGNMASGVYILRLRGDESSKLMRFTLDH